MFTSKQISDTYLLFLAILCLAAALVAMLAYGNLPLAVWLAVFVGVFMSPCVALYGTWKLIRGELSRCVAFGAIVSLLATAVSIYTVNGWLSAFAQE
jgi:hypothetical protein